MRYAYQLNPGCPAAGQPSTPLINPAHPVTTPSGKPPLEEQGHNSGWAAASDNHTAGPGHYPSEPDALEPPTQRQRARADEAGLEPEAERDGLFGAAVPYGGDDHTEEIDPVALDAPFTPDERKTPPAPAAHAQTPRAPVAAPREPAREPSAYGSHRHDNELKAPVAQLVLSDLFDSVPSSAAMAPPDPAAFTSSRPPAPERSAAVVALPSIDIGASSPARGEPSSPARRPSRPPPAPAGSAPAAASPAVPSSSAILSAGVPAAGVLSSVPTGAAHPPAVEPEPRRRSVPTLESVGAARSGPEFAVPERRDPPRAPLGSSPGLPGPVGSSPVASPPAPPASSPSAASSPAVESSPVAAPPPSDPGSSPSSPGLTEPLPSGIEGVSARFPSDIPTSRPPDVMLSPAPAPFGDLRSMRERAALATVTAPAPVQAGKAQEQLPSIMLADDVEAEPDSSARRAMRAARATVRLELPPGFGRPGSPVGGSAPPSYSAPPGFAPAPAYAPGYPPSVPASELAGGSMLGQPRTRRLLGFALAALAVLVMLLLALRPRTGSLVVTALGPGNRAVDDVTIFVDGKPLCDISPCRIKGLGPGVHTLRASAPNLASRAEESVEITAGEEATYNIDLLSVAPEVRAGGLRMAAADVPLTLYLDGKRVGRLPQEISGLPSGKHWVKLDPEDGTPAIEKSVNIVAGETVVVDPTPAQRDKALVTIRLGPGSEGASVTFDDAFLLDFPAELELEPNTMHSLTATKPGFEDLAMEVKIGAGETEKLIEVTLAPLDGNAPPRKTRPKATRKAAAKAPAATAPAQLADPTQGLLNISSVPPSQIILNGRPLGTTPKTGIAVPGDSLQTIVFVHPKMGRRRAQKFVPAGKERTVSIRF
jgi:hypothetical protein